MTSRLKRDAYVNQSWYDREQDGLFSHSWHFAGLTSDFKEAGDYRTQQAGRFPIFVIQQNSGALSAFHNVCRHRGSTLLEGAGNTGKSIICPYHRWAYVSDGRLKGAPQMKNCFPDLDRAALSLKPASIGSLGQLVFVNPDPNADFESFSQPLKDNIWPHDLAASDVTEVPPLNYRLKCNWKVFVENAIDGYHLAYLHENTLGGPLVDENLWERCGNHMIWFATDEKDQRHALPDKNRKEAKSLWARKIKSADSIGYGGVYFLFPNTLIAATPYSFSISVLHPKSPTTCDMTVRNFGAKGDAKDQRKYIQGYDKTTDLIQSTHWTKPPLESGDFQTEDVWICEKVQMGLNSPAFEPGPLSKGAGAEDPIRWFHEALARKNE